LNLGADLNEIDGDGNSIVHKAITTIPSENIIQVLSFLRSHGASVLLTNHQNETPLHVELRRVRKVSIDILSLYSSEWGYDLSTIEYRTQNQKAFLATSPQRPSSSKQSKMLQSQSLVHFMLVNLMMTCCLNEANSLSQNNTFSIPSSSNSISNSTRFKYWCPIVKFLLHSSHESLSSKPMYSSSSSNNNYRLYQKKKQQNLLSTWWDASFKEEYTESTLLHILFKLPSPQVFSLFLMLLFFLFHFSYIYLVLFAHFLVGFLE